MSSIPPLPTARSGPDRAVPADEPARGPGLTHLRLPVDSPEIGSECVWAEPLGGSTYRVANVPFFVHHVGLHDVVTARRAPDGELELAEVLERRSVAGFTYELDPAADAEMFFADARATGAATECLSGRCFTTNVFDDDAADRFELLLASSSRWFERFDATGRLVRERTG